jgi:hypothetical protein
LQNGQRVTLIQATGKTLITGFVNLNHLFTTPTGIVKFSVEAYVVKGMSTDFILGNDFVDQYDLSIVRSKGTTRVIFGDTQHSIEVPNSLSPLNPYVDKQGQSFKVLTHPEFANKLGRNRAHRKSQTKRKRQQIQMKNQEVRASYEYIIPAQSCRLVCIHAAFLESEESFVVERQAFSNSTPHEMYALPKTLILQDKPFVWISNFSSLPITISKGQLLGKLQNPNSIY